MSRKPGPANTQQRRGEWEDARLPPKGEEESARQGIRIMAQRKPAKSLRWIALTVGGAAPKRASSNVVSGTLAFSAALIMFPDNR